MVSGGSSRADAGQERKLKKMETMADIRPDAGFLRASVAALDPVVALLALVHLTGDRSLLHSVGTAFDGVPRNATSSFGFRTSEIPKEADPKVVADIRARLIAAMEADPKPLIAEPDRALFHQMAELCAGMELDPDRAAMAREQSGFSQDEYGAEARRVPPADFEVLVLGAGMIGLTAAIKLKASGFRYRVIERHGDVGGTWLLNTYPNVAVDTPSVQYSLSFDQNADWTRYYPRGGEYHAYLRTLAERHRILDRIDFHTEMENCIWDDARNLWRITCRRGGEDVVYEANAVIVAFGFITRPLLPKVDGLKTFRGPVVHSGQWDDSIDLDGRKVVVVGTGATSAQLATYAGGRAAHLTVVQRQPNYMLPDENVLKDVDPAEKWGLQNIPFVTQWQRFRSLIRLLTLTASPATIDPDYRARTGGVSAINEGSRQVGLRYIEEKFADRPDLKAKVTPDFPYFTKRPILDCGYYDTLKRDNVDLVEGTVVRCEEDAVILADGTRITCDVLLLATGYELSFLAGVDIRGRGGKTLEQSWAHCPYAYKGLEVPGFPNFFVTCGPNSGLTASHTTLGEQQVHYIIETLKLMVDEDLVAFEVTAEACGAYQAEIERKLADTIWMHRGTAHGYYLHASGKVVLGYPGTNFDYWLALRRPVVADHKTTPRGETVP
jgi:4-hydroxyacetophenone monooxygenase